MKKNRLLALLGVTLILLGSIFSSGSADRQQNGVTYTVFMPLISKPYEPLWIGPEGGSIVALAIAPSNSSIIYAGTWGAGVYRSADGGVSWTQVNKGLPNLQVYSLAVDPIDPDIVYTGLYRYKLYKSTNGGANWVYAGTGVQAEAIVYSIVIDPQNRNKIMIATRGISNDGSPPWRGIIYMSKNGGASWTRSLENIGGTDQQDWAYSLAINPQTSNEIFAAHHEYGVYKGSWSLSSNDWVWHPSNQGIDLISGKRKTRAIAFDPQNVQTLFVGMWDDRVAYVSKNSGGNWGLENVGDFGGAKPKIYDVEFDFDGSTLYTTYLAALGGAAGKLGVLKSTNSSYTWQYAGLQDDPIWTVVVDHGNSNIVFAGTQYDGLYRSTNAAANWSHSQSGIINTWIDDIVVMPDAIPSIYTVVHENGILRQLGEGQPWSAVNTGLGDLIIHALVRSPGEPNRIFALTDQDGLYTFIHPNGPWEHVFSQQADIYVPAVYPDLEFESRLELEMEVDPTLEQDLLLPLAVDASLRMRAMAFSPSNPERAYVGLDADASGGTAVYSSSNYGLNWAPTSLLDKNVTALAVNPYNANIVYAATTIYATPPPSDVVYYSQNGGVNWSPITPPANAVYTLAFSPFDANRVYAGTDNGVYVRDGGGAWTHLGFAGMKILSLATHPAKTGVVFAGTEQGVQVSYNAGLNWSDALPDLSGDTILSIDFDPVDPGYIYFGTQVSGIVKMYYR